MPFVSTSILSSVSLTANAANNALAAQQDLDTFSFNGLALQLKLTNTSAASTVGVPVTLYFAFGMKDFTGIESTIPAEMYSKAQSFQLRTAGGATGNMVGVTAPYSVTARYLYTWLSYDTLGAPVNVSIDAIGYAFGAASATNINTKFREAFEDYTPGINWDQNKHANDIIQVDGNTGGSSYLVISKCPVGQDTISTIETTASFDLPLDMSIGVSRSQATVGTEFAIELVDTAAPSTPPADLEISTIQQATTTLTINTVIPHGLVIGKRFQLSGITDSRLNYQALVVSAIPSPNQFLATAGPGGTIPSLSVGPFNGGTVSFRSALGYAENGSSMIFENASLTQASFYVRSEAGDASPSGTLAGSHAITVGTSTPVVLVNSAYSYAFAPTTEYRLSAMVDRIQWHDSAVDSTSQTSNRINKTQIVPNINRSYKLRVRATNNKSLTAPVGKIVSVSKAGSTTWTIVTELPHGLTTSDYITIYGNRDATNFPNVTTPVVVSSIVSPTSFTLISTTGTATSVGGAVYKVNGGIAPSSLGVQSPSIQSITRTANILTVNGSVTWPGISFGDYVNIYGSRNAADGTDMGLDGAYRVQNTGGSNMYLEPIGNTAGGPDFVLTTCGGVVIKRTDLRISFVRVLDYERLRIEAMARPSSDSASAMPVAITNAISATITTVPTTTPVAGMAASSSAVSGNPVRAGAKAFTTLDTSLATGDTSDVIADVSNGAITCKPYGVAALDVNIVAPAAGTITNSTTPVVIHAAPAAGTRNYITACMLNTDTLGTATEFAIRGVAISANSQTIASNILTISTSHGLAVGDAIVASASTVTGLTAGVTYYVLTVPASTTMTLSAQRGGTTLAISGTGVTATLNHILWRTKLQTSGIPIPTVIEFPNPLRAGTAVATEVVTLTASTGAVYFSAYGYQGQ